MVDKSHTALIVVDMQNDYCSSNGCLAKAGVDTSSIQEAAPRIVRLLEEARRLGITTIHTRNVHSEWTDSPARKRKQGSSLPKMARYGTWGADWFEEYKSLRPLDKEYVISKHRYSAFMDTDLDLILRARGIRTIVMSGVATNVCVGSTAIDGYMKGYHVVFLRDCTATQDTDIEESFHKLIDRHFGYVVNSEDVLKVWRTVESREPPSGSEASVLGF